MDKKDILTNKFYVILLAIFSSILWGSAFPVLKISYDKLGILPEDIYSKILFAGMRFFIASLFIFVMVVFILKESIKIDKKILAELFLLGLLQTSLQYFFFYNGLAFTTGMKGAILASSGTFFVVILAHFIYKDDKLNLKKIVGLISGFVGILLVNWGKAGLSLTFNVRGEGFLIIAGLVSAFGTIIAKRLSRNIHPFIVTAWQMLLGSSVLLTIGFGGTKEFLNFSPLTLGLLLYAAFLSATAFSLWYALLKYNRAGEISLYKFMIPVSGSFLSALLIPKEDFTLYMIAALGLVALGIVFVNYRRKPIYNKNDLQQH